MGQPNTYQLNVGTTPTPIASNPGGCITIFQLGTVDVFIGGSSVSLTSGIPLPGTVGACIELDSCDDWYAIAASTARIAVIVGTRAGLFFLGSGGGSVGFSDTLLTSAQVKALTTTPVQLIPAPGAGKILLPFAAFAYHIFGGVAYGTTGVFHFRYQGDVTAGAVIEGVGGNIFLSSAFDRFVQLGIINGNLTQQATIGTGSIGVNKAIEVYNDSAAFTLGNGNVRIQIGYRTMNI